MSNTLEKHDKEASRDSESITKEGAESEKDEKVGVDSQAVVFAQPLHLQLDTGDEYVRFRRRWWQFWLPKNPPPPAPASLDDAQIIPLAKASLLSMLTYTWITDIMILGYQRTLQASDLYKMDTSRQAEFLGDKLDAAWDRRVKKAADWNRRLQNGDIKPGLIKRLTWSIKALGKKVEGDTWKARMSNQEKYWRDIGGKKEASLAWALNDTVGINFWLGGILKVFADTTQLMGPIIVRNIIDFSETRATARADGTPLPNVGPGIGMAIGSFLIIVTASVCTHQFFWRSMTTGVLARAALIASIYKRGVHLTGKERTKFNNSVLVNHISTDVSRVDACAQWFHAAWTAPIQVMVCLIILLVELGPSALAGFSLFLLIIPVQERIMSAQFQIRSKSMKWTDERAKVLLEVLGGMRIVKYFSYEVPFLDRIFGLRNMELKGIKSILHSSSASLALATSLPALSATLAFVTYTLTSKNFNVAVIFSSLSLFQLLRQPMMFMPRALSNIPDAHNALKRLSRLFHAELATEEAFGVNRDQEAALVVEDATFEWETFPVDSKEEEKPAGGRRGRRRGGKGDKGDDQVKAQLARVEELKKQGFELFKVKNVSMTVPRGRLVAIVGPVGSGKSSLLQGLIGEMRRLSGNVTFGGRVGYCPQTAWIQNATLRDNILFGQSFDEDKYWRVVEVACLLPDLQLLPDGDLTEIGEKGINLSGGQKQRVNIARALYFDPDIVIFDDPLSAVDAHVGKALFQDAIFGHLRNRGISVILVTHALHFLNQCDYIYTMNNGAITESGTYQELILNDGDFARLDKEFGGRMAAQEQKSDVEAEEIEEPQQNVTIDDAKLKSAKVRARAAGTGKLEGRLMVKEKRTTGSVSWGVYGTYLEAAGGYITAPLVMIFIILMQGSQILNTYTLVWWEDNSFGRPNSFYQILYACLAIAQAAFTFLLGYVMDVMSFFVSQNLHHQAVRNVFYAPMSFFDTTPLGRILSIFGKDIDSIDNQLAVSIRLLVLTLGSVVGSVIIVTILEYYFIIAVVIIAVGYAYFAAFYRASAREMKRLDSMLRSILYAHFSETLTGLPTIRSYGEMDRFIKDNKYYIDLEDRALFLTTTNQRWLAIRLDFMGGILVFIVSLFSVIGVSGIQPAQIGLVLTYATSLSQMCGLVTRQTAEVENYMNSVERVVHYSHGNLIDQEAPHENPDNRPPEQWPSLGAIEFKDIKMSYRSGLPDVLKGISLSIKGGEKIGVVGRTGAGKSSLMLALFRIVELNAGSIFIDDIDISTIGLRDLRSKIAIIPQDPLLFSGTIRSNLDPFSVHEDAHLWDALRRSYLTETRAVEEELATDASGAGEDKSGPRFNLESVIESEGANLSVGERSLLSLARALVKDSRVVVLDEATASVDLETDSKIQKTIQTEFKDRTLLCIAHRLRTIISYDRILVMDAGQVAEFDTPLNLFNKEEGIFRGMCERSNISLEDIRCSLYES